MKRHDPKTNREMSTPLGTEADASVRLEEFGKELHELRLKHHLLDMVCIWNTCHEKDGGEAKMTGSLIMGNQLDCLLMAKAMATAIRDDVESMLAKAEGA